jgi:hypothetical protein
MAITNNNKIIRKLIVAFGNLFNNISLVRYNTDGTEQERFLVPITYAPKELYVQRLSSDPDLDKKVQMTLPRMSYEMIGMTYDSSRKQNTNIKNFAQSSSLLSQYNPVPYNFDFSLLIYTRNFEDVHQIVEYVLPFFTPDYTINVNLIPEMGVTKEIPIILNSTDREVLYEGDRESDPRMIVWTLNFTVKGFVFGNISNVNKGLILNSITHIYNEIEPDSVIYFTLEPNSGSGTYTIGEMVYQGYSLTTATATAQVVSFDDINNNLYLNNIQGNFISNLPVIGVKSNATYKFTLYNTITISETPSVPFDILSEDENIIIDETNNLPIQIPVDIYDHPNLANTSDNFNIVTKITET